MAVLELPQDSKVTVVACLTIQAFALYEVATHHHRSAWLALAAFFIAGFITDLISGFAHFGFDYVWPPWMPILGPISVEFREHHVEPTLDPSAIVTNLTKGAYGAVPFGIAAWLVTRSSGDTAVWFLIDCTLLLTSIWMLGFHQIHSYAHMGSTLSPDEFNRAVADISRLPARQQKAEFAKLFETVGIPPFVRLLQRSHLFLRPEIHWRHHISFESDFSSVNGWSDPITNLVYGPIARRKKAAELIAAAEGS